MIDGLQYIYIYMYIIHHILLNTSYFPVWSKWIKYNLHQSTPTKRIHVHTVQTLSPHPTHPTSVLFWYPKKYPNMLLRVLSIPWRNQMNKISTDEPQYTYSSNTYQYISIHNDLGISIWDLMWDFSMHLKSLDKFRHSAPVPLPKAPTSSCSNLHLGSMSAWGWWLHRKWNPHDFLLTSQIFLKQSLRACWCPSLVGYNVYIPSINPIVSLVPSKTSSKGNRKGNHGFTPKIFRMSCWISLQLILQLIQYTSRYPLLPFNTLTWLPKPSSLLVE